MGTEVRQQTSILGVQGTADVGQLCRQVAHFLLVAGGAALSDFIPESPVYNQSLQQHG
jgi:hypothetical protein